MWCIQFPHPYRPEVTRLMIVFPSVKEMELDAFFEEIRSLKPVRGEIHITHPPSVTSMQTLLQKVGLDYIPVNATRSVGYLLHDKATTLQSVQNLS